MIQLTRRYRFSAAHRLHSAYFSETENQELYGKCNHPFGHGHDYVLDITIAGPVDQESGTAILLPALDELVNSCVVSKFDHRDLNSEAPEFASLVPTSENLVRVIEARLQANWPSRFPLAWPRLQKIRLQETKRNLFEQIL